MHLDREIKIQGAKWRPFYNASQGNASGPSIHDPTIAIFLKTVYHGSFIVTVDRSDQTVTKLRPIKRLVLHDCMHSSWISIKLTCIDTNPLISLDSILFLFHFRIHGGVEIKIWWRIEGEIASWSSAWRSWRFRWLISLITSFQSLNGFSGSGFSKIIVLLSLIFI